MTIYLTILNTIAIIYLFGFHKKFSYHLDRTFHMKTMVGIYFYHNGKSFWYLALKNKKKVEVQEETLALIACGPGVRYQKLCAMFSWMKTDEQVRQFEKDYEKVDRKVVADLVSQYRFNRHKTQA